MSDIKNLLKQLSGQYFSDPTVDFLLEFESFLDQTTPNIKMKKEFASKLRQKNDDMFQ